MPAAPRALLGTLVAVLLCALGDFGPAHPVSPSSVTASAVTATAPTADTTASVTVTHADSTPCTTPCGAPPPRVAPDGTPAERHTAPGGGALVAPGPAGPGAARAVDTRRPADITPYTRPLARPTDRAPPLRSGS
ncbi:hypothetical protein ACIQNU_38255 [Streptomyces sp. NPDC091292]|uniref:hypothetical protein n=1 Tax=Streptomyces sp. NPDC091292 TaxID=3365991 RepID=UPI00381C985C